MSPIFETVFPEFANLDAPQPYDTEEGAVAALAEFERRYLAELGERELTPEEQATASRQALGVVDDLNVRLKALVTAIMPSDAATDNTDYVVEYDHGTRLTLEDLHLRLASGSDARGGEVIHFRIANSTLEQNLQSVLDQLTAKRIAEEMDAATYIERLRGAFRRARDGAGAQAALLASRSEVAGLIAGRIGILRGIGDVLKTKLLPRLESAGDGDPPERLILKGAVDDLDRFGTHAAQFSDHFQKFLTLGQDGLDRVRQDFAAEANMAGAEGESILVSRDIERHAFYRPLPLLWALIVTLLVKIVLAHNTSETLHFLAVPLLVLTFVLTWILSIFIGVWARASRMKDVQRHLRRQLRHVLFANNSDEEIVEFPRVPAGFQVPSPERLKAYPYRGNAIRHKRTVFTRNLWALLIPAVLAVAVLITRKDVDHDFIARFPGADACVLASGRMVFATDEAYFVKPSDTSENVFEMVLARVFPELMADVVSRSDIISVRSFARSPVTTAEAKDDGVAKESLLEAAVPDRLQDCVTATRGEDSLTIIHEGNAFGAFASEQTVNVLKEQTQNLITAIASPRPFNVEFDGASIGLDIPAELRGLRLTLDASNKLAKTLVERLEVTPGGDAIVQVLDQKLSAIVKTQEDLGVALSTSLTGNTASALVVTPTVLGLSEATGRDGAGGSVDAHIFQTSIELPGDGAGLHTLGNTLVLPFFTAPVENGDASLATPAGAFAWGGETDHLVDPEVTSDGTSYFERIAQTLESCLRGNATVEIDIIGLASRSWGGRTGTWTREVLNYHLAEGRRIGALRRLSELMTDGSEGRVLVQLADGSSLPMPDLIERASVDAVRSDFLPRFGRFESQLGFENRRDELLAVTGLDPFKTSPLEELFGRSVVLRMVRTEGGPCAF